MSKSMNSNQKTSKALEMVTTLPFWRQLRGTLIVSLILFATIPLLVMSIFILRQIDIQMRQQVERQLESVAELKINQIELWLDNSQSFLALILANSATRNQIFSFLTSVSNHELSDEQIQQHPINGLLHQKISAQTTFEEFFIYTRRGQVIASSDSDQIGSFVTNQHYFLDSLDAQVIQPPYYELGRDELTMVITLPLVDPTTSKTVGVIAGRLSSGTLGEIMTERTGLGDTGETYLVSSDNNYLVTPSLFEDEGYTFNQTYRSDGIDRALNGENGTDTYLDYRDPAVPVIGVYRWLPQLQVAMLAEVDEAEALSLFDQVRNLSFILVGVMILVAIGVGLYVAVRITQPITALTQVAIRISQGDIHQQANVNQRNEIGVLARAFNRMTTELQQLIANVEQRSRAIETSAEVSRRLSTILDERELVSNVVEQVRSAFDYYYAHIYLFDATKEDLIMAGGTGEAGRTMLARGHTIPKGKGLVGRAAETNDIVLVPNVANEEGWLPNPLLPETKAEVAVPIAIGNDVIGVLDVQHNVDGGLGQAEAELIQSIANQVAIALQNARQYEQAKQQADREAIVNTIGQKIQQTNSIEDVLQVAVRELGQALGARRTDIQLERQTQPITNGAPKAANF